MGLAGAANPARAASGAGGTIADSEVDAETRGAKTRRDADGGPHFVACETKSRRAGGALVPVAALNQRRPP